MKWAQACALALAATSTIAGLTLPVSSHASVIPVGTVSAVRPVPANEVTSAVKVTNTDDLGHLRLHLIIGAAATSWKVKSGDTLSLIAKNRYSTEAAWPLIYWANHKQVTWANRIQVGQILALPMPDGPIPAAPKLLEPLPPPPPPVRHVTVASSSTSSTGYTYHRTYTAAAPTYIPAAPSTYRGSGGMESCIISRESGGNSQITNSSGHYGLYQFSESTWVGSGGSASSFGHASVAQQKQVFNNAVAARGYSDWRAYDGC